MNKFGKILKFGVKTAFFLLIIAVNVIMLWRVLFSGDPKEIGRLTVNDGLRTAYADGELLLETQEQRSLSAKGLFAVTECIFIPEADQIQVVVRYNNSTLKKLASDFGIENIPERTEELFDVSVVKTIDKTPEDKTDNIKPELLEKERYHPSGEPAEAYKRLYSYRRYVFENVSYDGAVGLFVDIYYKGAVDYEQDPYGLLCIYDGDYPVEQVKLSGADRKALLKDD